MSAARPNITKETSLQFRQEILKQCLRTARKLDRERANHSPDEDLRRQVLGPRYFWLIVGALAIVSAILTNWVLQALFGDAIEFSLGAGGVYGLFITGITLASAVAVPIFAYTELVREVGPKWANQYLNSRDSAEVFEDLLNVVCIYGEPFMPDLSECQPDWDDDTPHPMLKRALRGRNN